MAATPPGPPGASLDGERLESWKEIAVYLGRTVRTVQRWERQERLPVHRLRHDRQGSVYALRSELDEWWRRRQQAPEPVAQASAGSTRPRPGRVGRWPWGALAAILAAVVGGLSLPPGPEDAARPAPVPGVAVLPFDVLGSDPRLRRLAGGLGEDLITELGRLDGLRVYSRTSVLALGAAAPAALEVRERLGASHLVEGSLRGDPAGLQVTARLVRASDQTTLWSATRTVASGEVPGLQRSLARQVAAALLVEMPEGRGVASEGVGLEAYEAFLLGREELRKRTGEGFEAAERALLEATRQAPRFARAWAALADDYALMANYGTRPVAEATAAARRAVDRALELDPTLGEAWAARAFLRRNHDWDFAGAEADFRKALELSPGDVQAWSWYVLHLSTLGRFGEAEAALDRIRELDPLNRQGRHQLANLALNSRRWEDAVRRFRGILELEPDDVTARLDLGRALAGQKRFDAAVTELERVDALSGGDPMAVAVLGNVLARAGRADEARAQLARLEAISAERHVGAYLWAVLLAGLGENQAALDRLEQVVAEHHVGALSLPTEPELDSLRDERRFRALLDSIGLPASPDPYQPSEDD